MEVEDIAFFAVIAFGRWQRWRGRFAASPLRDNYLYADGRVAAARLSDQKRLLLVAERHQLGRQGAAGFRAVSRVKT